MISYPYERLSRNMKDYQLLLGKIVKQHERLWTLYKKKTWWHIDFQLHGILLGFYFIFS